MKIKKNLLVLIALCTCFCLFTFGFKVNEESIKETVVFSIYNTDMILTFADGKQELVPLEKDKTAINSYMKTVTLTLNRLNKAGYSIKSSTMAISSAGTFSREYILEK